MDNRNLLLREEFAVLLQYRGTEPYAQFVKVLRLLEDSYKDDLATVKKDALEYRQGALAQARVLREQLIESRESDIPKV